MVRTGRWREGADHPAVRGQRFWARGHFSTTSENITDDVIMTYLDKHAAPSKAGFSPTP
jgi:putative transposase